MFLCNEVLDKAQVLLSLTDPVGFALRKDIILLTNGRVAKYLLFQPQETANNLGPVMQQHGGRIELVDPNSWQQLWENIRADIDRQLEIYRYGRYLAEDHEQATESLLAGWV